jgi:hypothetical protein
VNGHIRELEGLGHPVDSLSSFLVTLLLQKMPSDLQVVWMRDGTRSPADYETLMAFIRNELIALDQRDRLNERETTEAAKPATKCKGSLDLDLVKLILVHFVVNV